MRIYDNCRELMSETGRNLWEMGAINSPKTYQNVNIEGKDEFQTKELICEQYCLTQMPDPNYLFLFTKSQKWADAEFEERVSGKPINPGSAWRLREDVWEDFLQDTDKFDYSYAERISMVNKNGDTKLNSVIELLKKDPDTRKAIIDIYGVSIKNNEFSEDKTLHDFNNLDGKKRIPCSMYYDFLLRKNQKGEPMLNICYHQRSSDFITHFGNDVYLAFKLMQYIANKVGVKEGYLFHTIDSLHAYKKDWGNLKYNLAL